MSSITATSNNSTSKSKSKHGYSQSTSSNLSLIAQVPQSKSTFSLWKEIELPAGWQRCIDENGAMSFKDPKGQIHWKPPNVSLKHY